MSVFLDNKDKVTCFGCEACVQSCSKTAIKMVEDDEGFKYPVIDEEKCINCGLCRKACPFDKDLPLYKDDKYVLGGYSLNAKTRFESTSGGAFSEIVNAYCDTDYVIFGAEAKGLDVFHSYISDKKELGKFRKSKYSQSRIGTAFADAKRFLKEGKKVLFSGTPCQIAGLKSFLGKTDQTNLLTVEVICEGVPSPLYVRKWDEHLKKCYGCGIANIDYRYTGKSILQRGKWDFQQTFIDVTDEVGGGQKSSPDGSVGF